MGYKRRRRGQQDEFRKGEAVEISSPEQSPGLTRGRRIVPVQQTDIPYAGSTLRKGAEGKLSEEVQRRDLEKKSGRKMCGR